MTREVLEDSTEFALQRFRRESAGRSVVLLFADARPLVVDRDIALALDVFRKFGTREGRFSEVVARGMLPPGRLGALRRCVDTLREHGVIATRAETLERLARSTPGRCAPVDDVVVVSRGRPELAARCLASVAANARAFGRDPIVRLFVDDDDPDELGRYLSHLTALQERFRLRVRYSDPGCRSRAAQSIAAATGVAPDVVRLCVLGRRHFASTRGANTNAAVLDLAARSAFLSVDDDVVCEVRASAAPPSTPATFNSDRWPVRMVHYPDARALAADGCGSPRGVDYLGAHERWLGKTLGQILDDGEQMVTQGTGPEDLIALSRPPRVVATCGSFYGDSGSEFPRGFLFAMGRGARPPYWSSEPAYTAAIESRLVWKGVESATVGRGEFIQSLALGMVVDPSAEMLTPPFFPVLRCSDNLFGSMVRRAIPDARVCYLPEAVRHNPAPARRHARQELWTTAPLLRCHDFTVALLSLFDEAAPGSGGEAWLLGFSDFLERASRMETADLHELLLDVLVTDAAARVSALQALLDRSDSKPDFWVRDVEACCDALLQWIAAPQITPSEEELRHAGLPGVQELWGEYATVLRSWPALLRFCCENGDRLSREL